MNEPDGLPTPDAEKLPAAVTDPSSSPAVPSSAETNAQTFVEKTQSESGNEGSQTSVKKPAEVTVGSKLGPYLLVRKLGQGAMGSVYEARHTKLDKTFALKVLPPGFATNAAALSRFEREMKAVGKLDHPHIIRATGADEWNGTHYLVMEYIEGTDLSVLVKERGVLSVRDACKIIRQAALGLQHAHEHGLVHRDIKPSNLFLTKSGQVKLLDLGLARLGGDDKENAGLTSSGQLLGTPDYMAPEQWDDTHTVDARADLYSLGCTLAYLLTGKAPFDTGKVRSFLHIMKSHAETPPPDLTVLRHSVSAELNALFQRLMAKKPADRFQTAAEVATALEPFTRRADAPHDKPSTTDAPRSNTSFSNPNPVSTEALPSASDHPATGLAPVVPALCSYGQGDSETQALAAERGNHPDKRGGGISSGDTVTESISVPASVPRGTSQRRWLIAAGLLAFAVLAAIILKLTKKDGTTLEVTVPDGTKKVEITESEISNSKSQISDSKGWHGWPADAPPPAIAPFDAKQAQQHQEAWAKYLKVPVEYENSLGMKFRLIPPGEFTMGSTLEQIDALFPLFLNAGAREKHRPMLLSEVPARQTVVHNAFYIGVTEVTQSQYHRVVGTNPAFHSPDGGLKERVQGLDTRDFPVEGIRWVDAAMFCVRLSELESLPPHYVVVGGIASTQGENGYQLPSETRWEFACRAGTTSQQWYGDRDSPAGYEWLYPIGGEHPHAVAELRANPFGLYDLLGNVAELCEDYWSSADSTPLSKPPENVSRGGHFSISQIAARSASRSPVGQGRDAWTGLRLVLAVVTVKQALKLNGPAMPNGPKVSVTDASTSSTAKALTPLPQLDLDETDPLPGWELPAGAPPPVVAPCEPTLAKERQQLWAEFLKRPVIEELDVAALAKTSRSRVRQNAGDDANDAPRTNDVPRVLANAATKDANASTLKFALIPPGEFRKIFTRPRDPAIEPDMPVRRFRLTKPYALSTTEVTWDQFRQFVEATGYQTEPETNGQGGRDRDFKPDPKITWRTPGWKPAPNEPVTQVTPRDAEAFCAWLTDGRVGPARDSERRPTTSSNEKPNGGPARPDGRLSHPTYRLPTEAEWLHACRAGSVHKHVVGPEPGDLADYAWTKEFLDPNPQASPLHLVAQKKPNPFGLHDTLGNVWEYTRDFLTPVVLPYLPTENPLGTRSSGVLGIAYDGAANLAHPDWCYATYSASTPHVGFRVLKQFDGEPLPGPLDRPLVLRAGQPLSVHALVPRPEKIPGLQSWSIELAGPHTDVTTAIAASPKGDLIATGSHLTGKISLWDRDGNYRHALLGHEGEVSSLDFSPDGRWLASCEIIGAERPAGGVTARVWNVETGALHTVIPLPGSAVRARFSPNGDRLAVSFSSQYQPSFMIVDLATGSNRMSSDQDVRGAGLAWSQNGNEITCSHGDNHLRVWDAKTLKVLRDVEAPLSRALERSPDGNWFALRHSDGKVAIRDGKTLEVVKTFGTNLWGLGSHDLAWLADSKRIVVTAEALPNAVVDTTTGDQIAKFDVGTYAVAIIDEGQQAVFERGGRLFVYDTSTGQKLREGRERGKSGDSFTTLAADGRDVVACLPWYFSRISTFDAATGNFKRTFDSPLPTKVTAAYPSPDGSLLGIAAFGPPTMHLVDPQTGAKRHELSHDKATITRVAWSPDAKWLATGTTDKLVRVWNVATGKFEHELAGHTGTIWSLAWSPDGTRLASAAEDKTVRLWNPLAGKLVATYDQFPEAVNFGRGQANEAKQLAWTADSRRLWIALTNNIVPLDVDGDVAAFAKNARATTPDPTQPRVLANTATASAATVRGTFGPLENFSNGNVVAFLNTSPNGQRLLARETYGWTFVRGRDAQDRRLLGQHLGWTAQWHPDSRRFLGWEPNYGTVGFDVETNRRLGILFPWLTGDHWLCLGPTGHYRGSPGVEDQFVYVAMLPDGSQRTYTPAEFAAQFGWKNDPEKAELLGK